MTIKVQVVTLRVPFNPEIEDDPAEWDWSRLADTISPVEVVGWGLAEDVEEEEAA